MELVVAVTTLLGGAVGGLVTYLATRRRIASEERRFAESQRVQAETRLRKYRDPLIRAAFDLQSRLYNIVVIGFLQKHLAKGTPQEADYARESTLYVLAEYLGWVEIVRLEVQFLDVGDLQANRQLSERLDAIRNTMLGDEHADLFRVFRGEQRAIGELMITHNTPGERECMGFASFVSSRSDPDFSRWFSKLEADIDALTEDVDADTGRVVSLQHALIDLLDFLDPDHIRFATRHREKIPAPDVS